MDQTWTVEAEIERIEHQRTTAERRVSDDERRESALLATLLPASAVLAGILRDLERRSVSIRRQRHHEVAVFLRQPAAHCVRASLRWGAKFDLTDAERHLMRSYQTRPRRLQRYPEVVVARDYAELSGVLDAASQTLTLGCGRCFPLDHVLAQPSSVLSALSAALDQPRRVSLRHLRADDYRSPPLAG